MSADFVPGHVPTEAVLRFLEEWKASKEAPCYAYPCSFRKKCAEQQLACETYVRYVRTGQVDVPSEIPTRVWFDELDRADPAKRTERKKSCLAQKVTREQFPGYLKAQSVARKKQKTQTG